MAILGIVVFHGANKSLFETCKASFEQRDAEGNIYYLMPCPLVALVATAVRSSHIYVFSFIKVTPIAGL